MTWPSTPQDFRDGMALMSAAMHEDHAAAERVLDRAELRGVASMLACCWADDLLRAGWAPGDVEDRWASVLSQVMIGAPDLLEAEAAKLVAGAERLLSEGA
jgi:hypothetical protein